jgi:hypothetical protein
MDSAYKNGAPRHLDSVPHNVSKYVIELQRGDGTACRHPEIRPDRRCGAVSARGDGHGPGSEPTPVAKTAVLKVDLKILSGFPPEYFAADWHPFKCGNIRKGVIRCAYEQLPPPWRSQRLFLRLGAPQAAACWGTGYAYRATTAATPLAPRRYGYMSYGYSSPAYFGGYYGGYYGGIGIGRVGYRVWVGAATTDTEGLALAAWALDA